MLSCKNRNIFSDSGSVIKRENEAHVVSQGYAEMYLYLWS